MATSDDYVGEMGQRLTAEEIDRLLDGADLDGGPEALIAAAIAELREAFLVEPSPELSGRHLAAMAAASPQRIAPTLELPPGRRLMRYLSPRRVAAIAAAAALCATAGLAGTGTLPRPAQDFVAKLATHVGVELPGAAEHGQDVSHVATDETLEGCEKAAAVVDVAAERSENQKASDALEYCGGDGTPGPPSGLPTPTEVPPTGAGGQGAPPSGLPTPTQVPPTGVGGQSGQSGKPSSLPTPTEVPPRGAGGLGRPA